MKKIYGVRIKLAKPVPGDTGIGLYTTSITGCSISGTDKLTVPDGSVFSKSQYIFCNSIRYSITSITGNVLTLSSSFPTGTTVNTILTSSEFRWSEQPVIDTSGDVWKSGIIAEDGIGDSSITADFISGGNVSDYDGYSIAVINTAQIPYYLQLMGLSLTGCVCQLYMFSGTEEDLDAGVPPTIVRTGICETPKWCDTELTIPIKSAAYRRNGNIATVINNGYVDTLQDFVADVENGYGVNYPYADNDMNGKIVPCTFGTIDKAKLLRTASAELPFVVNGSIPSVYPVPVIVSGCSSDGNGGLIVPNGTAFTIGESVEYNNLWYCISAISGNTLTFTHAFPSDIVNSTINRCCYETQLSKDSDTTQYKICYPGTTLTYGDVSSFPVVVRDTNRSNSKWYTIQISTVIGTLWERTQNNGNWNAWGPAPAGSNATQCTALVNWYIKQAQGDGKGGRVITSAAITDNCKQITITLKDVFESNLTADSSAEADTTTWVELLDVKREYSAEYAWPCAAIGSN